MSFRLRLTFFGAALVALTVLAFGWLVYLLATNSQGPTQDDALRPPRTWRIAPTHSSK